MPPTIKRPRVAVYLLTEHSHLALTKTDTAYGRKRSIEAEKGHTKALNGPQIRKINQWIVVTFETHFGGGDAA